MAQDSGFPITNPAKGSPHGAVLNDSPYGVRLRTSSESAKRADTRGPQRVKVLSYRDLVLRLSPSVSVIKVHKWHEKSQTAAKSISLSETESSKWTKTD